MQAERIQYTERSSMALIGYLRLGREKDANLPQVVGSLTTL